MSLTELCLELEHYETPKWAARSILDVEPISTFLVDDPCTGTGVLAEAVRLRYPDKLVLAHDVQNWGYSPTIVRDYLSSTQRFLGTVFMNPPFSLACEFVEHALLMGAAKVIAFQRFAWFESEDRKDFFTFYPPDRIWLCGNRATSWRHDISAQDRKIHPVTGKKRSGSSTAYAFFVWTRRSGQKYTTIDRIWRLKGEVDG